MKTLWAALALLALWNVSAKGQNLPNLPIECDPYHCESPCPDGRLTYTNIYFWPGSLVCQGTAIWAAPEMDAPICDEVTVHYWYDNATTNCPEGYYPYTGCPEIITNWYVINGPGSYYETTNGNYVWFAPTNCGSGTITFGCKYGTRHPCNWEQFCNVRTISISSNFVAVGVASLTPEFVPPDHGGLKPGSDPPTYWVCPCSSGEVIVTASSCPPLTADQLPDCWTFTGGVEIDKLHHKVSKADLLNGPVTFTVSAGTSTKTIILKADEEKNLYDPHFPEDECKYDNFVGPPRDR